MGGGGGVGRKACSWESNGKPSALLLVFIPRSAVWFCFPTFSCSRRTGRKPRRRRANRRWESAESAKTEEVRRIPSLSFLPGMWRRRKGRLLLLLLLLLHLPPKLPPSNTTHHLSDQSSMQFPPQRCRRPRSPFSCPAHLPSVNRQRSTSCSAFVSSSPPPAPPRDSPSPRTLCILAVVHAPPRASTTFSFLLVFPLWDFSSRHLSDKEKKKKGCVLSPVSSIWIYSIVGPPVSPISEARLSCGGVCSALNSISQGPHLRRCLKEQFHSRVVFYPVRQQERMSGF